jgi:hypothetical protein
MVVGVRRMKLNEDERNCHVVWNHHLFVGLRIKEKVTCAHVVSDPRTPHSRITSTEQHIYPPP